MKKEIKDKLINLLFISIAAGCMVGLVYGLFLGHEQGRSWGFVIGGYSGIFLSMALTIFYIFKKRPVATCFILFLIGWTTGWISGYGIAYGGDLLTPLQIAMFTAVGFGIFYLWNKRTMGPIEYTIILMDLFMLTCELFGGHADDFGHTGHLQQAIAFITKGIDVQNPSLVYNFQILIILTAIIAAISLTSVLKGNPK